MGWRGGKRRVVAVAGAAGVVLGFLSALVLAPLLGEAGWTAAAVAAMVMVPVLVVGGFVLMWEALVTWPDDGSPYPLRPRAKAAATVLVAAVAYFAVLFSVGGLLGTLLPRTWWGDTLVQGLALVAGLSVLQAVWRRLRTGHWSSGPSPSDQHG